MADIRIEFPENVRTVYTQEMENIKKSLSQFPGHKSVASSLAKFVPQEIVAGLIGCIIPESGSDHTILNAKEYNGKGKSGTEGWNCGEGLIQWTYWKYKLPLIQTYNKDSRSTQKLPTDWEQYRQGTPISKGNKLCAASDGRHIAGLSLDNQMLFLTLYYGSLINKLKGETNLAVIVAKIYQQKAGVGLCKNESNPIIRAYETSKRYYPSPAGNHYLQSLKIAADYLNCPVPAASVPAVEGDYSTMNNSTGGTYSSPGSSSNPRDMSGMNDKDKKKNIKGIILGYHMRQK